MDYPFVLQPALSGFFLQNKRLSKSLLDPYEDSSGKGGMHRKLGCPHNNHYDVCTGASWPRRTSSSEVLARRAARSAPTVRMAHVGSEKRLSIVSGANIAAKSRSTRAEKSKPLLNM